MCEPFSGIKHCLCVLGQLYVELKDRLERFSSNTSDFRAKYVKPVELQCIYLVLQSTSKLKLNHDVLIVTISGLMRFQVPSNTFKKKSVIILKNELWYSMVLPVLFTIVVDYQLFLASVVYLRINHPCATLNLQKFYLMGTSRSCEYIYRNIKVLRDE